MAWLRGHGGPPPVNDGTTEPAAEPQPIEGAAPGVAALLERLSEDRSHAVLDLGLATHQSLSVYSRFARWIYFADLSGGRQWPRADGPTGGLQLPKLERLYDVVFAWDILDRLSPEERPRLAQWLVDVTAPGGRVHVVVRSSEEAISQPLRFNLVNVGRIQYEPVGTDRLSLSRLLPAEVAKVLAPLQVQHAFTLKNGLREYLAVRP